MSLQDPAHSRGQGVVRDGRRDTAPQLEHALVARQECLLSLVGKDHHEEISAGGQAHGEQMRRHLLAIINPSFRALSNSSSCKLLCSGPGKLRSSTRGAFVISARPRP